MIIGITGGIGSGKSVIARKLHDKYGFTIYDTDSEAKRIISYDTEVKQQVEDLLGSDVFDNNGYNTVIAAQRLFADRNLLRKMNNIVHPAVAKDIHRHKNGNLLIESALLFDVPAIANECEAVIAVIAPTETRIQRAMMRDGADRKQITARMDRQMSSEEMATKADIVVNNDGSRSIDQLADEIYKLLYKNIIV